MRILSWNVQYGKSVHNGSDFVGTLDYIKSLGDFDAICLQETWLNSEEESAETYYLQDKTASYVSVGDSRGIANYFSSKFVEGMKIAKPNYQIAAIETKEIMIINIYRSSGSFEVDFNEDFTNVFESNHGQNIIIAIGDFNFCEREEANHKVREMLLKKNSSLFFTKFLGEKQCHQWELTLKEDV